MSRLTWWLIASAILVFNFGCWALGFYFAWRWAT